VHGSSRLAAKPCESIGLVPNFRARFAPTSASNQLLGSGTPIAERVACDASALGGESSQQRIAEEVGLPSLFRVDTKAKKVLNLDAERRRESPIRSTASVNGRLVLFGGEAGRGWVVTIHEESGMMTSAVATDGEGYVVFGQCALP